MSREWTSGIEEGGSAAGCSRVQEERPAKVLEPRNILKKTKFSPSDGLDQDQIALLLDEKER